MITISLIVSLFLTEFFTNMKSSQIDDCKLIGNNTSEEYFECLQQNDLDTWDMNNKELTLRITWWTTFILSNLLVGSIFGLIFFLIFIEY